MTFLSGLSLQGGDQQLWTRQCCDGSRELQVDFNPKGQHWVVTIGECDSGKAKQKRKSKNLSNNLLTFTISHKEQSLWVCEMEFQEQDDSYSNK